METQPTSHQGPTNLDTAAALQRIFAELPVKTFLAGETVFKEGLKTGELLILKTGAVAVFKDSVAIARVDEPGTVLGEISALLHRAHAADVWVTEDATFYVADAALLEKDPTILLHVARILAQRLAAADIGLVELKKQLPPDRPSDAIKKVIEKLEEVLRVGGSNSGMSPGF
jgi:CRP-like cAMP-binding protein